MNHPKLRHAFHLALLVPSFATAATTATWTNPAGGDFSAPANWSPAAPPSSPDTALFDLPGNPSYTVSLSSSPTHNRLVILDDHLTIDLANQSYTLTDPYPFPNDFSLDVSSLAGGSLTLTSSSPAGGSLTTTNLSLATSYYHHADLTVLPGVSLLSYDAYVAANHFSTATATVTGAGAVWRTLTTFNVGTAGDGTVNVLDGGSVFAKNAYIGASTDGHGTLLVDGPTSTFNARALFAGWGTTGSILLRNHGTLISQGDASIGYNAPSSLAVDNANVTLTDSTLFVGNNSAGTASITNGSNVNAQSVTLANRNGSTGNLTLDAATITTRQLIVGLGGTGTMLARNGATLRTGSTYLGFIPDGAFGTVSSGNGTLTVTDPGTLWAGGYLYVGYTGGGSVLITHGAQALTGTTYIGFALTPTLAGTGTIAVSGADTYWTTGAITIDDHSSLAVTDSAVVLSQSDKVNVDSGSISVAGAGSHFTSGPLSIGRLAPSSLTLSNSAALNAPNVTIYPTSTFSLHDGTLTADTLLVQGTLAGRGSLITNLKLTPTSALALSLNSPADYDRLTSIHILTLDGTLAISLAPSYTPAPGTSFDLLDFFSLTGTFSALSLPPLPAPLTWDISSLYSTGVLTVLPEPTLLCLLPTLLLPRRRNTRVER